MANILNEKQITSMAWAEGIKSLLPDGVGFTVEPGSYETLVVYQDDQDEEVPTPSEADVTAAVATFTASITADQYKAQRESEYPSIGDQLDALYHAGVFPADLAATIQAVKDKYPKP